MVRVQKTHVVSPCGHNVDVSDGSSYPVESLVGAKFMAVIPSGVVASVVAADAKDVEEVAVPGALIVYAND